jgi:Ohr subfamily peroxiredoxin
MKVLFTAVATTKGGRNGHGETEDGKIKVDFSLPKDMGGPGGPGATPEHLFATGYSACFGSAIQYVAGRKHLKADDVAVTAHVHIGVQEAGAFGFEIELAVRLPGVDRATAEALVHEAHGVCPYSNAIRGNVPVKLAVLDA